MACATLTIAIDRRILWLIPHCVSALVSVELDDVAIELWTRIAGSGRFVVVERGSPPTVRLAPFAELALREATDIALAVGLDGATRASRVRAVLAMAGY